MKVADCMTRNVKMASPQESLRDAARMMAELDAGILPVADGDRLVGMITDRDICVRAVAQARDDALPYRSLGWVSRAQACEAQPRAAAPAGIARRRNALDCPAASWLRSS